MNIHAAFLQLKFFVIEQLKKKIMVSFDILVNFIDLVSVGVLKGIMTKVSQIENYCPIESFLISNSGPSAISMWFINFQYSSRLIIKKFLTSLCFVIRVIVAMIAFEV